MSHHEQHHPADPHAHEYVLPEGHSPHLGHIQPFKTYVSVLVALFVLTAVTVGAAYIDFEKLAGIGGLNIVVAMVIASVKAMCVALYFMHLKYENPVTWLYAIFPIILLFILIGGVFLDNPYRVVP